LGVDKEQCWLDRNLIHLDRVPLEDGIKEGARQASQASSGPVKINKPAPRPEPFKFEFDPTIFAEK